MIIGNIGAFLLAPFLMTSAFAGFGAENANSSVPAERATARWEKMIDSSRWSSILDRMEQRLAQTDDNEEPEIISIDPSDGPVGTEVVLNGEGFTEESLVRFGRGVIPEIEVNEDGTALTFMIPDSVERYCPEGRTCTPVEYDVTPGDYRVRVQQDDETSNRVWFEVIEEDVEEPLNIESIAGPTSLLVGEEGTWTVGVEGEFEGNLQYSVVWGDEGMSPLRLLGLAEEEVHATATFTHTYHEPGTYTPEFTVTDEEGNEVTKESASVVVVDETEVHIESISPERATVGETVTLTGHGFDPDSIVTVGGVVAEDIVVEDDSTITFTVPELLVETDYRVVVENEDGTSNPIRLTVIEHEGRISISGINAPTRLEVGQVGMWTVDAETNLSGNLSYSVVWGDEVSTLSARSLMDQSTQASATFTHVYADAGTFMPEFTVTDEEGNSSKVSASVVVVESD